MKETSLSTLKAVAEVEATWCETSDFSKFCIKIPFFLLSPPKTAPPAGEKGGMQYTGES